MCNRNCIKFCSRTLKRKEIHKKRIIEVGSLNVNGSVRHRIEKCSFKEYIGVDIRNGVGVDVICDAVDLIDMFGENSFDILICTEVLEHVEDWKTVIHNFKLIVKPRGKILITTRTIGAGYHPYSDDFWRYTPEDMRNIFSDFKIKFLKASKKDNSLFIKLSKPVKFIEHNISNYKIYSVESEKEFYYNRARKKLKNLKRHLKLKLKSKVGIKNRIKKLEKRLLKLNT